MSATVNEPTAQAIVIGCCFLDYKRVHTGTRGTLRSIHHGGVGRNVAENLAWCGVNVRFITLARPGMAPKDLFRRLENIGVHTTAREVERGVGEFHALLDSEGSLLQSSAVVPELRFFEWNFVREQLEQIQRPQWVIVETGLPQSLLTELTDWTTRHNVAVCGLPTRLRECGGNRHILQRLSCLILNQAEAAYILGQPLSTVQETLAAAEQLVGRGIAKAVITMGARGVVAMCTGEAAAFYAAPVANAIDGTGAGDAFAAALLGALIQKRSFKAGILAGLRLAHQTVESYETSIPASLIDKAAFAQESA